MFHTSGGIGCMEQVLKNSLMRHLTGSSDLKKQNRGGILSTGIFNCQEGV